jgi:hypothetical protein
MRERVGENLWKCISKGSLAVWEYDPALIPELKEDI